MNPADGVDLEVVRSKALKECERQIAKVPYADRFSVTFNGTSSSSPARVTDGKVDWPAQLELELIKRNTMQIRNNLRAVEVLDELWDNGTEVVVIPKATLDVLDCLLQGIETASQQ